MSAARTKRASELQAGDCFWIRCMGGEEIVTIDSIVRREDGRYDVQFGSTVFPTTQDRFRPDFEVRIA